MNHEHQQRHAQTATTSDVANEFDLAPGRAARTDGLIGKLGPRPSGLLMRKATRDDNNVAADADLAVGAASTSSGTALPDELRTRFETSLGTDLSSVRVHTGAASATAAESVGAKAYTLGNDIHFGAGHYDPSSRDGEHLLAHEVAHTVQQAGMVGRRAQFKLDVSSPGDAHEVEADSAASAMVSGGGFTIAGIARSINREPARPDNPSYSNRDPDKLGDSPARNGEGERGDAEAETAKTVDSMKSSAFVKCAMLMGKSAGLTMEPATLANGLQRLSQRKFQPVIDKIDVELASRKLSFGERLVGVSHVKRGVEIPIDNKGGVRMMTTDDELAKARGALQGQSAFFTSVLDAANIVGQVNSTTSKALDTAAKINGQIAAIDAKHFSSAKEATAKIDSLLAGLDGAVAVLDTTAMENFQAHPDFDSAKEWGRHIGDIFHKLSGLGSLLNDVVPGGGEVVTGLFEMPGIVIDQFTAVVEAHYARIDAKTRGPGQGVLLPSTGGEGPRETLPED